MRAIAPGLILIVILSGCGSAELPKPPSDVRFVEHFYKDALGHESRFTVFVPASYDPKVPCPTILFLHGAGQRGRDGKAPVQGGLGDAVRKREATFPFLTIFPQAEAGPWTSSSPDGKSAIEILQHVQTLYNVDAQRIYLTGYSMGGEGTWSLAGAYPDRFAAIVPICPSGNRSVAAKLKEIPCWCFQGDADAPNTVADTRRMLLAIKAAGGNPIYHEYPGVDHNCWDLTYANDDVFEWMLQHSRPNEPAASSRPTSRKEDELRTTPTQLD